MTDTPAPASAERMVLVPESALRAAVLARPAAAEAGEGVEG